MTTPFAVTGYADEVMIAVSLEGDFDLAAKPIFIEYMDQLLLGHDGVAAIDIDLAGLTFLDSTGIGALVGVCNRADQTGRKVRAYGARGVVAEVLFITGVAGLLNIDQPDEYAFPTDTDAHTA